MLPHHYSNNLLSHLQLASPAHLEVVEHHSLAEEDEVDIEIEVEMDLELDSTRMSLDNMRITDKRRHSTGVNNRCLILCRLRVIICKCTDEDLCLLLLNPRLLFPG
jgi:hypothetical protein